MKIKENPASTLCSRRRFIKSGMLLTASLPVVQAYPFANHNEIIPASTTDDALFALFRQPPATAKPFVRWWWNGNKLTAAEILRELDVMHEAGIGGVEINPIAFPGGDDLAIPSLTWLSDEWIEMVKVALKGAEARGMICDIIVGSGWPFGAEILEGDDRSQLMTLASRKIVGGETVEIEVDELIAEAKPQIGWPYEGMQSELWGLCLAPEQMDRFVAPQWLDVDLSQRTLRFTAPSKAAIYIMYAMVKFTGFQAVINGAPGAAGPVLNHYNAQATQKFLHRMSDTLFPKLKGLKGFRAMFCDSMELEGANWCSDYVEEFQRRRGYDVKPYLPYILYKVGHMGHIVQGTEITQLSGDAKDEVARVRYDFFITCMEIIRDRFLVTYTQWCNRHGFKSRMQPYGNEFHPLEASLDIDIPECETWMWRDTIADRSTRNFVTHPAYTNINKYVASAARLTGKKIVSCEESTNTDLVFNATLEQLKVTGDQSNLSGVTHSILHGYNYSPLAVPFPGWIRYGMFLNERNPWWSYFKHWATYKTRISALLQETEPFADIAVLHPLADMWTQHGPQRDPFPSLLYPSYQYKVWEGIHKNGNSCDYTCESIIQQSKSMNGYLIYGKRKYHTLLLLEVETLQPETAKALATFVARGGKLIFVGKEPYQAPGLKDYKKRNRQVASIITAMKKAYAERVFIIEAPGDDIVMWFADVQRRCNIKPYMQIDRPNAAVSQVRHRAQGKDIYFVCNTSVDEPFRLKASFMAETDSIAWLWDAETGERFRYPDAQGHTLTIDLPPASSQLIVFDKQSGGAAAPAQPSESTGIELQDWMLRMEHLNGTTQVHNVSALFDLAADDATRSFAGQLYYEKELDISASPYRWLDLGKVHGVSEATLDGVSLGCRWYGRHLYRMPENSEGKTLQIKITTTAGNYLKASTGNVVGQRWTNRQAWASVGMLGPVKLF